MNTYIFVTTNYGKGIYDYDKDSIIYLYRDLKKRKNKAIIYKYISSKNKKTKIKKIYFGKCINNECFTMNIAKTIKYKKYSKKWFLHCFS